MSSRKGKSINLNRGFTLVEVLVSLTLLAGLLAVTYSGFSVALTMWEKSNDRAQEFEQRQTVFSVLRDQVSGALPVLYSTQEGVQRRQRIAFEGQVNGVRFVSATSWRDGSRAVPRWIELHWTGTFLQVDERQMLSPLNNPAERSFWHLELNTFQELRFRFLRRAQGDRAALWMESWDMEQQHEFPAAVALEGKAGGETYSLVIPLDYAQPNWKGYQVQ